VILFSLLLYLFRSVAGLAQRWGLIEFKLK